MNYIVICIDVGGYGKSSESGVFIRSELGKRLKEEALSIPGPTLLGNTLPLPHVIVGDEALTLKKYLMRPYPGNVTKDDETKTIIITVYPELDASWKMFSAYLHKSFEYSMHELI